MPKQTQGMQSMVKKALHACMHAKQSKAKHAGKEERVRQRLGPTTLNLKTNPK